VGGNLSFELVCRATRSIASLPGSASFLDFDPIAGHPILLDWRPIITHMLIKLVSDPLRLVANIQHGFRPGPPVSCCEV
jgi:hypothetical protein